MLKMFRRDKTNPTIESLYGVIVAQARQAGFYTGFAVPDTVEGRFELLVLHTFLICHRLKGQDERSRALSQAVFDAFLDDMDRTLREMGIGDLAVPKRMKKIGAAFYGRSAAYDAALAHADEALQEALARNILERPAAAPEAVGLAVYVRRACATLHALPFEHFVTGAVRFPSLSPDEVQADA